MIPDTGLRHFPLISKTLPLELRTVPRDRNTSVNSHCAHQLRVAMLVYRRTVLDGPFPNRQHFPRVAQTNGRVLHEGAAVHPDRRMQAHNLGLVAAGDFLNP